VTVRLGIDATSVSAEGKGIARVQRGTVRTLAALGRYELVVLARHPEELPEVEALRVEPRLTLAWEQRGLASAARDVDLMLTWSERLPVLGRGRFVVWLFEPPTHRIRRNREVGAGPYQRASDLVTLALWRRSLRRAALVLTASRATAEAIPVPSRVVYPGLEPEFAPGTGREGRYILHIGSRDPRDDTPTALAAFARARAAGVRLLVAGGYEGPPQDGVTFLGRVTDRELVDLYRGAAAYLDTTLFEGFGYQVLEAMACGAPVVATRTTSIPELAGEAGLLAEPGDAKGLAEALRRVLADPALAEELRGRGIERAGEFTWERTASELAAAVDEALR
jgi:glycosyltransferase involved in cell wall biosynthesis